MTASMRLGFLGCLLVLLSACGGGSDTAPAVTANPASLTVATGASVTFTAAASGTPTPDVQWQTSSNGGATFTNVAGATATTLSFTAVLGQNGAQFRAVFTNTAGSVTTAAATLTVTGNAPVVTTQPSNVTVADSTSVTFTAAASGTPVPTVQWQTSSDGGVTYTNVSGATAASLTFTTLIAQSGNRYRAVFTNSSGSATTNAAVLTVTGTAPLVTGNPANQTVTNGSSVSFTASASGVPAPLVQWQQSSDGGATFVNVAGATSPTYSFSAALAQNGYQYRAVFTNVVGTATSTAATLTVTSTAPSITTQPANQTVVDTASVTFTAAASGSPAPTVQWQQSSNGGTTYTNVSGATGTSLTFTATTAQSGYRYRAVFTNTFGTATTTAATLTVNPSTVAVVPLAVGNSSACAIKADHTVLCWGNNAYGELGTGSSTPSASSVPVSVVGVSGVAQIIASGDTYCAVKTDTTVVCWGSGSGGELGNGSVIPQDFTPGAPVTGLTGVVQVAGGFHHFCAVKSDTTLVCWGQNGYGQYGNGTTNGGLTPIIVPGLSGVVNVTGGSEFTCAAFNDGTAKCWGINTYGNLGDGTVTQRLSPVVVSGLSTAQAVSSGSWQSCALLTGGSVRCWGNNTNGQAGIGTYSPDHFTVPQAAVALGQPATAIIAQYNTVCALLADTTVRCWGLNQIGELGNGTTVDSNVPVAVSGLSGVTTISNFGQQVCARKTDHTIWCWGDNSYGQLGNGTTTDSSVPVQVTGGAIFY